MEAEEGKNHAREQSERHRSDRCYIELLCYQNVANTRCHFQLKFTFRMASVLHPLAGQPHIHVTIAGIFRGDSFNVITRCGPGMHVNVF